MFIGQILSALTTVRSEHHSKQVPNALDGRGICPIQESQMFVARARQVPYSVNLRRASRGTGAPKLSLKYLCKPLLWNG